MTVICMSSISRTPPIVIPCEQESNLNINNFAVIDGYTIDSNTSGYRITLGARYQVYGLLLFREQIRYLIQDDKGIPIFCPSDLFGIESSSVYWDWEIAQYAILNTVLVFIGYPDVSASYQKLIELIESKPNAIESFLSYKEYTLKYEITN